MIRPGQILEKYEVETLLGQGGMADVYALRHTVLGTRHALKVLHTNAALLGPRLITEGKVQAALRHPNIVRVTDTLDVDGHCGIVMDLVDGRSLDAHLEDESFDVSERLEIFYAVVDAVAYAHRHGIVHRDLKPGNIVIAFDGDLPVPKITDFGLVKVMEEGTGLAGHARTRSGIPIGTPAYMAPEQVEGLRDIDHRADIFALGCILYELVSGVRPFERTTIGETYAAVSTVRYTPLRDLVPEAPDAVVSAVDRCLKHDRADRPSDASQLLDLLSGIPRRHRQNRWRAGGWAIGGLVPLVAILLGWWALSPPAGAPAPVAPSGPAAAASAPPATLPPAPPLPTPIPAAATPPKAALGPRVTFTGARQATLARSDGSEIRLPAAVPPGSYTILADFGQGFATAGQATLRAGVPLRITCNEAFETCAAP